MRFDMVYVDPDRRPQGTRKSFQAEDYLPNVFDLIGFSIILSVTQKSHRLVTRTKPRKFWF